MLLPTATAPQATTQRQPGNESTEPSEEFLLLFFLCGGLLGNRSRRRCRLLCAGVPWPLTVSVVVPVLAGVAAALRVYWLVGWRPGTFPFFVSARKRESQIVIGSITELGINLIDQLVHALAEDVISTFAGLTTVYQLP